MTIVGNTDKTKITAQCATDSSVKPNNDCVNGVNEMAKVMTVAKMAILTSVLLAL